MPPITAVRLLPSAAARPLSWRRQIRSLMLSNHRFARDSVTHNHSVISLVAYASSGSDALLESLRLQKGPRHARVAHLPKPRFPPLASALPPLPPIHDDSILDILKGAGEGSRSSDHELYRLAFLGDSVLDMCSTLACWNICNSTKTMTITRVSLVANSVLAHAAVQYGLDRLITPSDSVHIDTYTHRLGTVFEAWIGAAWIDAYHRGEEAEIWAWGAQFYDLSIWQGLSEHIELENSVTVDPSALELSVRSQSAGSESWLGRLLGPRTWLFTRSKMIDDIATPKPKWSTWFKGLSRGSRTVELSPPPPDTKNPITEAPSLETTKDLTTTKSVTKSRPKESSGNQIKVVLPDKTGWSSLKRPPDWPHPEVYVNLSEFPTLLPFMTDPDIELLRGEEMVQQGAIVWREQLVQRLQAYCNTPRVLSYLVGLMRRPPPIAHFSLYYGLDPAIWLPHRGGDKRFQDYTDAFYAFIGWATSQAKSGGHQKEYELWLDLLISPKAWPRIIYISQRYEDSVGAVDSPKTSQSVAKSMVATLKSSKPSIVKRAATGPVSPALPKPAETPLAISVPSDAIRADASPDSQTPSEVHEVPSYWHPPWLPLRTHELLPIPFHPVFDQLSSLDRLWEHERDGIYKARKLRGYDNLYRFLVDDGHLRGVVGRLSAGNAHTVAGFMLSKQTLAHLAWHYGIYTNNNMEEIPQAKTEDAASGRFKAYVACVIQQAEATGETNLVDQWLKGVFSPKVWTSLETVLGLKTRGLLAMSRNPPRTKVKKGKRPVPAAVSIPSITNPPTSSLGGTVTDDETQSDGSFIRPTATLDTTMTFIASPDGEAANIENAGQTFHARPASRSPGTLPDPISEGTHATAIPQGALRDPPSHWNDPLLPFDTHKLPIVLPLCMSHRSKDPYPFAKTKSQFAFQSSIGKGVLERLLVWDEHLRTSYGKDVDTSVAYQTAYCLMTSQTMSHLALHLGFCEQEYPSRMAAVTQQAASARFLSYIGFVSKKAEAMGSTEEVRIWLKEIFSPYVWPSLVAFLDMASARVTGKFSQGLDPQGDQKIEWLEPTLRLNTSALPPLLPLPPLDSKIIGDDRTLLLPQKFFSRGSDLKAHLASRFKTASTLKSIAWDCAQEVTVYRNLSYLARFYQLYDSSVTISQLDAAVIFLEYMRSMGPRESEARRVIPWLDAVFNEDVWPDLKAVVVEKRRLLGEQPQARSQSMKQEQAELAIEASATKLAPADHIEQSSLPDVNVRVDLPRINSNLPALSPALVALPDPALSAALSRSDTPRDVFDPKSNQVPKWREPTLYMDTSALPLLLPHSSSFEETVGDGLATQKLVSGSNDLKSLLFNRFKATQTLKGIAGDCAGELVNFRNLSYLARFYQLYDTSAAISQANAARRFIRYMEAFGSAESSAKSVIPWLYAVFNEDVWPDLKAVVEEKHRVAREKLKARAQQMKEKAAPRTEKGTIKLASADDAKQDSLSDHAVSVDPSSINPNPVKAKEESASLEKPSADLEDAKLSPLASNRKDNVQPSDSNTVSTLAAPRLQVPNHRLINESIPMPDDLTSMKHHGEEYRSNGPDTPQTRQNHRRRRRRAWRRKRWR
ncbi:hypothetical protein IAR50_003875 [Cryptococcus sp. DSM 104548]